MEEKLKAALLIPAGFAGAMTVIASEGPVRTREDILVPLAILGPVYLGMIAVFRWMWQQPEDRRYLGHSRRTWAVLVSAAYVAGASAAWLL